MFKDNMSGLGFIRHLTANWDMMAPCVVQDAFDLSVQGAFFVFEAKKMRALQDGLRESRISADKAVILQLQQGNDDEEDSVCDSDD